MQRQIELVRSVCDGAEKVLGEARKVYGLSSRQGVAALATLDKQQAARIAEQEKLLRAASNSGEGETKLCKNELNFFPHESNESRYQAELRRETVKRELRID